MTYKNPVGIICNRVFYCLIFLSSICISAFASASNITPFASRDQNPLVAIFGQPLPVSAKILAPQQTELHISTNFSNTINSEQTANELFFIDIETHRINLIYDAAIQQDWMLRIQIPLIRHYGGFMDKWIDNYHHILSLPEGVRPYYPQNQMSVHYELHGSTHLDIQQQQKGLGDVALQMAYQAINNKNFALSYWASIKLPTGESAELTGSGNTDIALWFASHKNLKNSLWVYGNAGIVAIGKSDVLPVIQKNHALFLTTGLQFNASDNILLKVQLDNHSAFYKTETDFLGAVTQLTFGGSILLDSQSEFDIAIAEDIQTGRSPDVNFNLSWRKRF